MMQRPWLSALAFSTLCACSGGPTAAPTAHPATAPEHSTAAAPGAEGKHLEAPSTAVEAKAPPRAPTRKGRSPIGTNLGRYNYSTGVNPFVDFMKAAEPFHSGAPEHPEPGKRWNDGRALATDEQGWVRKLEPGQVARSFVLGEGVPQPSGKVTVLYEGEGELQYRGVIRDLKRSPGKDEFTLDAKHGLYLELTSVNPKNHLRNVRLYIDSVGGPDDGTFTRQFLSSLEGFSVLRAMDWIETNRLAGVKDGEGEPLPVKEWKQYTQRSSMTWHPTPFDVIAELGNRTGADIWVTVPHAASDDFVERMAEQIHDALAPSLRVYVEYSNETWNALFDQTYYVGAKGCARFADNPASKCKSPGTTTLCDPDAGNLSVPCYLQGRKYHALRTAEVMAIWEKVFADRSDKLVRVLGGRVGDLHDGGKTMLELKLPRGTSVREHVDAYATAPYFSGDVMKTGVDGFFEMAPAGTNGAPEALPYALTGRPHPHGGLYGWMQSDARAAARYPGLQLIAYEGGQHVLGHTDEAQKRMFAVNRDPRMKQLYLRYLDLWAELTDGSLFVHYTSPEKWTQFGAWGSKEYPGQPREEAPKHDALLTYVEQSRAAAR